MENIRKTCATIANTVDQPDLRKTANFLAQTFNANVVKSIEECDELLYWLYIYDYNKLCFDLCSEICTIQFSTNIPVFDYLVSINVLYTKLLKEQNLTDKAQLCTDGVVASYVNRPEVLKRLLEGSLLYKREIDAALEDNDIDLARFWKLRQYQRLCFISLLGGSEAFPTKKAELEMKELKSDLKKPLRQEDKNFAHLMQTEASDEEIKKLTDAFATAKIPSDFIEFYKIHNGQIPGSDGIIDNFYEILSIEDILIEWNVWKDLVTDDEFDNKSSPDPGIKNNWYNLLWIPFASNGCGDNYCLDLDPTPEGTYGQVISVVHDDSIRSVEAISFTSFLKHHLVDNYLERME